LSRLEKPRRITISKKNLRASSFAAHTRFWTNLPSAVLLTASPLVNIAGAEKRAGEMARERRLSQSALQKRPDEIAVRFQNQKE
jgi:hypothetical protein